MATIAFLEESGKMTVSHSDIDSGFHFTPYQIDQVKVIAPGDTIMVQSSPTSNRRFKIKITDSITIDGVAYVPASLTALRIKLNELFPDPDGGTGGTTTTNASLLTSGILPDERLSANIARTDDLADVATTGDYNDLINQPAIGAGDVTLNGSQTLTNKTLTAPVINSPTGIVKGDVGLGNADNTADASKPVSTAQSAAIAVVQSDINAHEALTSNPHSVTKTQVGLSNADNTSDVNKPVSTATQTALDLKADLVGGTVPANQLPAYVDDIEEYANLAAFPGTGLSNKEYYAQDSQITYRWTGSTYAPIGAGVALGETSSTAYRGDRGAAAYNHSILATGNPHSVTKTEVGLGNADNTADTAKPVSTAQQTALDLKANLASPTFTGTVAGITSAMVGLGSVDNTADSAKPVSTAQQTALNLKANLASPTFTGTPVLPTTTTGVTQSAGNSTTRLATTAFTTTANNLKANIASPTLTGTPAAPTAAAATNTTQIATTAHVFAERSNTATLTNKTISGASNTLSNIPADTLTGTLPAARIAGTVFDGNIVELVAGVPTWSPYANGKVNSGAANSLTYYAVDGTHVDDLPSITPTRVLVSNANGLPVAATPTTTEINHVAGVTSGIQTQINSKQATLVSATNIKTINGTTLLGSGDMVISPGGTVDTTLTDGSANAISNNAVFDGLALKAAKSRLPLNALDYATGDGTTDDTTTLNAWLAAGDYLYLGEGTYKISSQLASTSIRTDVTIIAHPNAKIVPTAAYSQSGGAFLKLTNITNLSIEGINIQGNGAIASPALTTFDNNMNGILIEDCVNVTVSRCTMTDQPKSAVRVDDCTNVKLLNITATNCYNGATEVYNSDDVFQEGCTFSQRGTTYGANGTTLGSLVGMFFNDCTKVRAIGNNISNWKNTAAKADGCMDTIFIGNKIDIFGKDGLKIQGSTANPTVKRGIMISNIATKMRTWDTDGSCYFQVADAEFFDCSHNVCEGDGGATGIEHGVSIPTFEGSFNAKQGIVSNNIVKNVAGSAYNFEKVQHLTVHSNRGIDFSTGSTSYFGMHFYFSCSDCEVYDNYMMHTSIPATNSSHGYYFENASNMDIHNNTAKNIRQEGMRIRPAAGEFLNVNDNKFISTNDVGLQIILLNGAAAVGVHSVKTNGNTFIKNCLTTSTKDMVIYTGNNANSAFTVDLWQCTGNTFGKGTGSGTTGPVIMYNDGFGGISKFDYSNNIVASGVTEHPQYNFTPTLVTEGGGRFRGAGVPEGVITADVGAWYTNITNGNPYAKTSGSGNTGWTAVI